MLPPVHSSQTKPRHSCEGEKPASGSPATTSQLEYNRLSSWSANIEVYRPLVKILHSDDC